MNFLMNDAPSECRMTTVRATAGNHDAIAGNHDAIAGNRQFQPIRIQFTYHNY